MRVDGAATARQDLLVRVRDVLKAVLVFKNQQPLQHTDVPAGTLGVLSAISHAVAALVRSGLVIRTADPTDGRANRLATLLKRFSGDLMTLFDHGSRAAPEPTAPTRTPQATETLEAAR